MLKSLSFKEKETVISFFNKYPVYENRIDWNNKSLSYCDFEKVFTIADSSRKNIKTESKTNPEILFKGYNYRVVSRSKEFLIIMPLDRECAVYFNSYNCGGIGAMWCIGDKNTSKHWNKYISKRNIFYFVYFINKNLTFGKKLIIQYNQRIKKYFTWNCYSNSFENPFFTSNEIYDVINTPQEIINLMATNGVIHNALDYDINYILDLNSYPNIDLFLK